MLDTRDKEATGSPEPEKQAFKLFAFKPREIPPSGVVKRFFSYRSQDDHLVYKIDNQFIEFEPVSPPRYVLTGPPEGFIPYEPGFGGMLPENQAFLMWDKKLDRKVVAKRCSLPEATILEARRLAEFQHPNIVRIYDLAVTEFMEGGGQEIYFIMESLGGGELSGWIGGKHTLNQLAAVVNQIASGITHLNKRHFIYADLKPKNVVLDDLGIPKIIDVALSTELGKNSAIHDSDSYGTIDYAPPEQRRGEISLKTDVYSFAAVVFDMLQGKIDFDGWYARNEFVEKEKMLVPSKEDFSPVLERKPKLYEELSKILRQALSKQPEQRQESVEVLNRELQKVFSALLV